MAERNLNNVLEDEEMKEKRVFIAQKNIESLTSMRSLMYSMWVRWSNAMHLSEEDRRFCAEGYKQNVEALDAAILSVRTQHSLL